jgi:hypothetical protein
MQREYFSKPCTVAGVPNHFVLRCCIGARYGDNPSPTQDAASPHTGRQRSNIGDKARCKAVLRRGTELLFHLMEVIRSVDWTKRFSAGDVNPVRQCQEAYKKLHTWLYNEMGDLTKTSAAIQLPPKLFQGTPSLA